MSRLIWGVAVAVTLWLTQPTAQAQAVDVDDLLAGVVATHTDADGQTSVTLIEPAPALSLPAGTAAHPRLSARGGRARWQGYLNLLAAGTYQFRAELLGQVTVKVTTARLSSPPSKRATRPSPIRASRCGWKRACRRWRWSSCARATARPAWT
jgi:hypothetical protein